MYFTRTLKNIFGLNKEERWIALCFVVVIVTLEAMMLMQYSSLFFKGGNLGFWSIFEKNFRMSGYDCWSYITLSNMRVHFETPRHPLFFSVLYPLYLINQGLMGATGTNFATVLMAILITFCSVYSLVFIFRTLRSVLRLRLIDAVTLTVMFYSFGHVMVTMMVPDHFAISLMLLTMTMCYSAERFVSGRPFKWWQTAVMLFLTAGITLTNGAKTVLASLFTCRRRFFSPANMLGGIVLPVLLLGGVWLWQYHAVEEPQKRVVAKIEQKVSAKKKAEVRAHQRKRKAWVKAHHGRPFSNAPLLNLTDATTPRWESAVENFFGEPIQLHKDYLLQDMSFTRPMIVKYSSAHNYAVEIVIVALFLVAVVVSLRSRLMLMLLSWWGVDIALHFGLGFGLNEVYIMTADWIFIIPVAIGIMMSRLRNRQLVMARAVSMILTSYLLVWNLSLIVRYLSIPMSEMAK